FEVTTDISSLAVDDLGRVVTGHKDGSLRIWDARAGSLRATAAGHAAFVGDMAIRGDTLITSSWDRTMHRWAFPSGEPRGSFESFDEGINTMAISPGGELIAVTYGAHTVSLRDGAQGRLLERIPTAGRVACAGFLDDDHLITGSDSGRLEIVDIAPHPRP